MKNTNKNAKIDEKDGEVAYRFTIAIITTQNTLKTGRRIAPPSSPSNPN